MTQGSGDENILAQLSKKIDDQARFSRIVYAMCTFVVVGVIYYTMTSEIAVLPDLILTRFMGNMEPLVREFKLVEGHEARTRASAGSVLPIK